MTALNKQALHEAAQEEIMLRSVSDTSDAWQDEASPEAVLALLDELEAKDKSIGFLKDHLAQLANFNPDWDRLEAATDSLREHMAKLSAAEKRIAELSASHSKLRDAMAAIHNTIRMDGGYTPLAAILNAAKRAHEESATAAGIGVKGE
ncbi:ead/Ea22-like family protein [Citrobacter portucalensis]|uniref:ead/Ea22-like family protein n=1 Tax=Citrobacter portucalensis TaxID=1639133 RepID=UPI0023B08147|nr:ead/Ea22-like family protein [Citrobacter portucalensis]